jgi:hypothetical protein
MSQDRTTPMDQPEWARRNVDADDQKTVIANQESVTPPTLPFGDEAQGGWGRQQGGGREFVRSQPAAPTPPPFSPQQPPFGPPPQRGAGPEGATMLISERPTPVFAWLAVFSGPDRNTIGVVHTLRPDTTTIGRVAGNQVVVHDETVSAQHARIRREDKEGEKPAFVLYDMGSRNGIYVGDKDTYKNDESRTYRHELQDGDYVLIGDTTLVFKRI